MLKELWLLVKMLFSSRPSDIIKNNEVKLVCMKNFPFKRFTFMSWCGTVIYRLENQDKIDSFLQTKAGMVSLTHEYGHAVQAESEHGDNWMRYYLSYLWHWLKHCPWVYPASACYYVNRYECEAFAKEEYPEYWKNYNRENLRMVYSIKNAKKKYKELGCTPSDWKKYVKSL